MNNRKHDERPEPVLPRAVDEPRGHEPLLDHHIEELLEAISALQTRIAPSGGSDTSL
jgi:hypothetical protein